MELIEWVSLVIVFYWAFVPLLFQWVQVVLLFPTIDRSVFFYNRHSPSSSSTLSGNMEQKRYHRSLDPDTPPVRGSYESLSIEDLAPETIDGQSFHTQINRPVWTAGMFSDTFIFSRKWYYILAGIAKVLIPLYAWNIVSIVVLSARVTSNYSIWYYRDEYPEILFGFFLLQTGLSSIFDIVWFPALFKMRCITLAATLSVFYTLFFTALYASRAVYHVDVGFGTSTVELLYYWYIMIITMIIMKERRYTVFTDNDLLDVTKAAPVTVYHDRSIHSVVPEDLIFARRRIISTLKSRKDGSQLYPHEIPGGHKYLVAHGLQAPVPSQSPVNKVMGWRM
jgi:hypothetical protein